MSKKRILFGILIVMVMAVCSTFLSNIPSIFANQVIADEIEIVETEAGKFYGEGFYAVGSTATLKAEMNGGYAFDAWLAEDEYGNVQQLSTEQEYTFVVTKNITIEATWHKINYAINFDASLLKEGSETELKDFDYTIENITQDDGNYYYNDTLLLTITIKEDVYIYDLNYDNITINGKNIGYIMRNENPMRISANFNNSVKQGFKKVVISINIQEDVIIGMDYVYLYKLQIVSGNDIRIDEIVHFVDVSNFHGVIDPFNYLVRADRQVTITVNQGDSIYKFVKYQMEGKDPSNVYSQAYTLIQNTKFTVYYAKQEYVASFVSYFKNIHGSYDLMEESVYDIADIGIGGGDTIGFECGADGKITITDTFGNATEYSPKDVYGYTFTGFAIDYSVLSETSYTLSKLEPSNVEIQLLFDKIVYNLEIKLVDEYFADDVTYSYSTVGDIMRGSDISFKASTSKYAIIGWSESATPKTNGYLSKAEQEDSDTYSLVGFVPKTNDNTTPITIYLDVDYKYTTSVYALTSNSIAKNLNYDVVIVDTNNKQITFTDSEKEVPDQQVTYLESDVTTDASGVITINAGEFGNVTINGDVLSYVFDGMAVNSVSKVDESGTSIYTFKKYTYYGDLKVSVVESIKVVEISSPVDENNITLTLKGSNYDDSGKQEDVELFSANTIMTYDSGLGAYRITYYLYPMYLYMNADGSEYDYIEVQNIKYYYDATNQNFVLNDATINVPKTIEYSLTKGAQYNITISNVKSNTLIIYSTKSTNESNFMFAGFIDKAGSGLGEFEYAGYKICVLNAISMPQISAEYRPIENDIILVINQKSAYLDENIIFTINGREGSGNTISAIDGDVIVITVISDYIARGYKFDGYRFNDNDITDTSNPNVLQITMDARVYANQKIYICFSEVQYTVNVYYINSDTEVINPTDAKGQLKLDGQDDVLGSTIVNLNGTYKFVATANAGYYVQEAYIGTMAYELTSLISTNGSRVYTTTWQLNSINFEQAIMNNADSNNVVNLYINFVINTYNVKVYFEIAENAHRITYPDLTINGEKAELNTKQEKVDGATTTKYFVSVDGFEYGTQINLVLNKFMTGTSVLKWKDASGNTLNKVNKNSHIIAAICENVVLKVELQYINYSLQFVILNEEGKTCTYGSATVASTSIQLFDVVDYTVNTKAGYVLKEKYYYNSSNEKVQNNIESGFAFNPSNFKVEDGSNIKIYLVFGQKGINLEINNVVDGQMYYFKGQDESTLATYTVTRYRNGATTSLDSSTGYQFQTGDTLVMEIMPCSIGIDVYYIKLGDLNITTASGSKYYVLKPINITEIDENGDERITGVYYELYIQFEAGIIDKLEENVVLSNVLKVRTYNITYTYNFIDYEFGITLIRQYNNVTAYGDEDEPMLIEKVGFGGVVNFSYVYEGMNTGISNKFRVDGFTIAGVLQPAGTSCKLENIDLWQQVALSQYIKNSNAMEVVLILNPKIVLENYDKYDINYGYIYERQYIGENQGLTTTGEEPDVVIGEDFEILVEYSYDGGVNYSNIQPINVGDYIVKIIAKISTSINVEFDDRVIFRITPATLTLTLKTYKETNPITKTYDGTNALSAKTLIKDMKLEGVYARDVGQLFIDETRLKATLSGSGVNPTGLLYDVYAINIYLVDASKKAVTNYKLLNGENVQFSRIGKITPKELTIIGFKVSDKVYDGTTDVKVDISEIDYVGKLESDSTQILTKNLKFSHEEVGVQGKRKCLVTVDWSNAVVGADSVNYAVTCEEKYIDIYPYEISYTVPGYGTFKVVDVDRLRLIPIGSQMYARVFERGSNQYRDMYSRIEGEIAKGEKLKICYEIVLRVGVVDQLVPQGLYVYLPKVNKTTKVLQATSADEIQELDYISQEKHTAIKIETGEGMFSVLVNTTYIPLWAIVLIVAAALLLLLIIVIIVILIRRKVKKKYSAYDKI